MSIGPLPLCLRVLLPPLPLAVRGLSIPRYSKAKRTSNLTQLSFCHSPMTSQAVGRKASGFLSHGQCHSSEPPGRWKHLLFIYYKGSWESQNFGCYKLLLGFWNNLTESRLCLWAVLSVEHAFLSIQQRAFILCIRNMHSVAVQRPRSPFPLPRLPPSMCHPCGH